MVCPKRKFGFGQCLRTISFLSLEEIVQDGKVIETYRAGPFLTSDESNAYAEQRSQWFERSVRPVFGTNRKADPFTFVFPPP